MESYSTSTRREGEDLEKDYAPEEHNSTHTFNFDREDGKEVPPSLILNRFQDKLQ